MGLEWGGVWPQHCKLQGEPVVWCFLSVCAPCRPLQFIKKQVPGLQKRLFFWKFKSNLYKLLKIIFFFLMFAFLMKTLIFRWSAVAGLTAGTGNTCNNIKRKTKGWGRATLHHCLPLLQHVTAQCLCAVPNSPVEKDRSLLQSRGKRKKGFAGHLTQTVRTLMPEVPVPSQGSH